MYTKQEVRLSDGKAIRLAERLASIKNALSGYFEVHVVYM